jgi:arsenate reductase-like glutaredoxin family protein
MRNYLKFDLPEEQEQLDDALKGSHYKWKLEEIWQNVFRPYYKHGYQDQELNDLLEKMGEDGNKLMDKLADLYHEVVNDED